jgi:hypothetical protein
LLGQRPMAIMATESANSSKKAESHEAQDERDTKRARPHEVGSGKGDKESQKTPPAEPETLDSDLEDLYDNVACTD